VFFVFHGIACKGIQAPSKTIPLHHFLLAPTNTATTRVIHAHHGTVLRAAVRKLSGLTLAGIYDFGASVAVLAASENEHKTKPDNNKMVPRQYKLFTPTSSAIDAVE
jgi:hypothetical protein